MRPPKERARKWYAANKDKVAERNRLKRAFIDAAKARPCADCGVQYPPYVMSFDHLPGSGKHSNISSMGTYSLDRIAAEIEKCEVVCHNCHAQRTHFRRHT